MRFHYIFTTTGNLPPSKDLPDRYAKWQSYYGQIVSRRNPRLSLKNNAATSSEVIAEIKKAKEDLRFCINDWLKPEGSFIPIWTAILTHLKDEDEEIRVIFKTDNFQLRRLPLCVWEQFFEARYHRSEIAIYLPPVPSIRLKNNINKIKVLAVLGSTEISSDTTHLRIDKDWEMLKQFLSSESNAEIISLISPDLEQLADALDEQRPQILFFAGHSHTEDEENIGQIALSEKESVTIEDLKYELIKAAKTGLKLAIFNSCDGIGIAEQLYKLQIPNIIVMREPLPDKVAHRFLQRFLEAFAAGKPLHHAVRRAREKLNRLEREFPGVMWLPMIWQNPAEPPLTWVSLGGTITGKAVKQSREQNQPNSVNNQGTMLWLPTQIPQPHQESSSSVNQSNSYIICPNCNYSNPHGTIQCEACYTPLSSKLSCPNCGADIQSNSIYCDQCGFNLNSSTLSNKENNHQPVKTISSSSSSYSPSNGSLLAGRYQIIKTLSQGGFSQTYMAQDIQLPGHPRCVVKQMKVSFSDPSSLAVANRLFNTEAEIIYKLNQYDKIPQLLAHLEENNEFYLVQEFIDGHELTEEISPGKTFSESEVIQLLEEVLEILDVVHNHNIIHRDIKPSNLIRRKKDGKLVLIDFGAGKEIQIFNNQQVSNATVIIGTSGYAAPEQMIGKPKLNSDIYSLGITAIHAVTGIRPYELNQSYEGEFDWHDKANISLKLTKIIDKMVCYNSMQRYQSAKEVLKDLNVLTHRSKNTNILTNMLKTVLISNKVQNQTGTRIIQNKSNVFTIEFNWIKVLCIILIIILAVLGWVKFTEKKSTHHDKLPRLEQK